MCLGFDWNYLKLFPKISICNAYKKFGLCFLIFHFLQYVYFNSKTDLQLQMEAQRICLSLVYSAHVDQVREYLQAEKESALCSLKEELVYNHAQEMNELKKAHQLELQTLKDQQTGRLLKMMIGNSQYKKKIL